MTQRIPSILTVVKLKSHPRAAAAIVGVMKDLAEASRRERGCLRFEALQEQVDPTHFFTVEQWVSEADADAHMRSPHVQQVLVLLRDLLAEPPRFVRYRSVEAG